MTSGCELLRRSITARARGMSWVATIGAVAHAAAVGFQANIASAQGDVMPRAVDASKLKALTSVRDGGELGRLFAKRPVGYIVADVLPSR